jgi:hypothetical protein
VEIEIDADGFMDTVLASYEDEDRGGLVAAAIAYFVAPSMPGTPVPPASIVEASEGRGRLDLPLSEGDERLVLAEARRRGMPPEALLRHAVIGYLAELDRFGVSPSELRSAPRRRRTGKPRPL